jgi:DNA-binding transcriptional LysR family regulator
MVALSAMGTSVVGTERPYLRRFAFAALLERWSAPFPGYFLCYPAQRQMAPALRACIDSVRSQTRAAEG